MASRNFTAVQLTATKGVVSVYFSAAFAGASNPTLGTGAGNVGVKSMTRSGTGAFTLTFGTPSGIADTYMALLGASVVIEGASPNAPIMHVVSSASIDTTGVVTLQFLDYAGAAADPGSDEVGLFRFDLRNSTAI